MPNSFAEVLGLYGLIVALILNTRSGEHPEVRPFSQPIPAPTNFTRHSAKRSLDTTVEKSAPLDPPPRRSTIQSAPPRLPPFRTNVFRRRSVPSLFFCCKPLFPLVRGMRLAKSAADTCGEDSTGARNSTHWRALDRRTRLDEAHYGRERRMGQAEIGRAHV